MTDTEYEVWRLGTEGGGWGRLETPDARVDQALAIARSSELWVVWNEHTASAAHKDDLRPISLNEWLPRFRAWHQAKAQHSS